MQQKPSMPLTRVRLLARIGAPTIASIDGNNLTNAEVKQLARLALAAINDADALAGELRTLHGPLAACSGRHECGAMKALRSHDSMRRQQSEQEAERLRGVSFDQFVIDDVAYRPSAAAWLADQIRARYTNPSKVYRRGFDPARGASAGAKRPQESGTWAAVEDRIREKIEARLTQTIIGALAGALQSGTIKIPKHAVEEGATFRAEDLQKMINNGEVRP